MGKPYKDEIRQLEHTYSVCMEHGIDKLVDAVKVASSSPLLIIGSGGSLSAAHFVAALHQRFTGHYSRAITPLELIDGGLSLTDCSVWYSTSKNAYEVQWAVS